MGQRLDRRSEFASLDEDDGRKAIKEASEIFEKNFGRDTKKYFTVEQDDVRNASSFIINAYYQIGMIDYRLASSHVPSTKRVVLLEERAKLSASLQYFIENKLSKEEFDKIFDFQMISELVDDALPQKLYHGRNKINAEISGEKSEVTFDDLGKADENGIYYTRDGMVYSTPNSGLSEDETEKIGTAEEGTWSTDGTKIYYAPKDNPSEKVELPRCSALWYATHNILGGVKRDIRDEHKGCSEAEIQELLAEKFDEEVKKRCQLLTHDCQNDAEKAVVVNDTHGGVPFMFQEQIYEASKAGNVKWLLPRRDRVGLDQDTHVDVINIANYADFVDARDANVLRKLDKLGLRMPEPSEDYNNYMEFLKNKEIELSEGIISSAVTGCCEHSTTEAGIQNQMREMAAGIRNNERDAHHRESNFSGRGE